MLKIRLITPKYACARLRSLRENFSMAAFCVPAEGEGWHNCQRLSEYRAAEAGNRKMMKLPLILPLKMPVIPSILTIPAYF